MAEEKADGHEKEWKQEETRTMSADEYGRARQWRCEHGGGRKETVGLARPAAAEKNEK